MKPKITRVEAIGVYIRNDNPGRSVHMRKGTLSELRGGKLMDRPVFFYIFRGKEKIVMRLELARDWYPKYGSHVCGDQHNQQPDLLAKLGERQDTTWEKWRKTDE